ncbi:MAG TPA: CAP domain-containing protein, partial [Paracoccaceae bacterium]
CSAAVLTLSARAFSPEAIAQQQAVALIAEVNALRAQYGLAPYNSDPILMSVAQAQNDWRLSAGVTTHDGPDGSRPRDRAIAAGYGGGRTVFISENIVDGSGLSPAEAVEWWTGDDPHLNTMIGENYRDVGAGVGTAGGVTRYTLMVGYVAGAQSAGSAATPGAGEAAAPPAGLGFVLSTPNPDGSIIHIVEEGETLWTIAALYEVDLETLRELNNLPQNPLLSVGDQVVVQPAFTPTPTVSPTGTPAPTATSTPSPTASPRPPTATITLTPTPLPLITYEGPGLSRALIGFGLVLMAAGVVLGMRRNGVTTPSSESPAEDENDA